MLIVQAGVWTHLSAYAGSLKQTQSSLHLWAKFFSCFKESFSVPLLTCWLVIALRRSNIEHLKTYMVIIFALRIVQGHEHVNLKYLIHIRQHWGSSYNWVLWRTHTQLNGPEHERHPHAHISWISIFQHAQCNVSNTLLQNEQMTYIQARNNSNFTVVRDLGNE